MSKPHILYILSDEHRGPSLSHIGDAHVKTPWMDRRAYANCPICTPSHRTIFSGRHAAPNLRRRRAYLEGGCL